MIPWVGLLVVSLLWVVNMWFHRVVAPPITLTCVTPTY